MADVPLRITVNKPSPSANIPQSIVQFDGHPIGEPQRNYNFSVELPSIGSDPPFVESIDSAPPFENISPKPEPIGGRHRFSAIEKAAGNLILTLYVESSINKQPTYTALEYIRTWQSLVQNSDGTFNYPDGSGGNQNYSLPITVKLLLPDTNVGYSIIYSGCFPINITPLNLSYKDNSGRSKITVTFSVDKIVCVMNSQPSNNRASAPNATNEAPSRNIQNLNVGP